MLTDVFHCGSSDTDELKFVKRVAASATAGALAASLCYSLETIWTRAAVGVPVALGLHGASDTEFGIAALLLQSQYSGFGLMVAGEVIARWAIALTLGTPHAYVQT